MAKIVYPLLQVLEIKERRVENAEAVVKERAAQLAKEEEKLEKCKAERDKVFNHHLDKLTQLRTEMDQGTTSPKIQQMKAYLKVVQEKLKIEEKKVKDQQEQVNNATKNLEQAREDLHLKRLEVDKLKTHQKDWEKELRKEQEIIEAREHDEIGNIIYSMHQRMK